MEISATNCEIVMSIFDSDDYYNGFTLLREVFETYQSMYHQVIIFQDKALEDEFRVKTSLLFHTMYHIFAENNSVKQIEEQLKDEPDEAEVYSYEYVYFVKSIEYIINNAHCTDIYDDNSEFSFRCKFVISFFKKLYQFIQALQDKIDRIDTTLNMISNSIESYASK